MSAESSNRSSAADGNVIALVVSQVLGSIAIALTLTVGSTSMAVVSGSDFVAGLGQASIIIGASIITIPVAALSARRGRRWGLGAAYVLGAVGATTLMLGFAAAAWPIMMLGLLLCGGASVAGLAARFAATDSAKSERDVPRLIAWVMWASTVGSIIGPNFAGPLSNLFGDDYFAEAFLLILIADALAATVVIGFLRPAGVADQAHRPVLKQQLAMIQQDSRILTGIFVATFGHAAMVALMAMAPVHLHHNETQPGLIGLAISTHMAGMYVFSPLVGQAVTKFGPRAISYLGLGLFAASALTLALALHNLLLMVIGLLLLGIAWSCTMIAGSAMVTRAADAATRISIQGVTDLSINVFGGVASLLSGLFVNLTGYPQLAWVWFALVAVAFGVTRALLRTDNTGRSHSESLGTDSSPESV